MTTMIERQGDARFIVHDGNVYVDLLESITRLAAQELGRQAMHYNEAMLLVEQGKLKEADYQFGLAANAQRRHDYWRNQHGME